MIELLQPTTSPRTANTHLSAPAALVRVVLSWSHHALSLQENCAILKELVSLRAQKSSLLGFHTHADYVLEMNMAKTSQTVATFLGSHSLLAMGTHLCPTYSPSLG